MQKPLQESQHFVSLNTVLPFLVKGYKESQVYKHGDFSEWAIHWSVVLAKIDLRFSLLPFTLIHSILKGSIDQKHAKTNEIWRKNSEIDWPFAWSHWLLPASMISRSFQTVEPGSHMPRSYLRHSCRCCLRHRSDMRTEVAGNRSHVSLYRQHACEVDSS